MTDVASPDIRITSREDALYLLAEAAAIEQNLMCCYLYAAFSFKRSVEDGLTPEQVEILGRWYAIIIGVAIEEMTHLSLVSNLTCALGGRGAVPLWPFAKQTVLRRFACESWLPGRLTFRWLRASRNNGEAFGNKSENKSVNSNQIVDRDNRHRCYRFDHIVVFALSRNRRSLELMTAPLGRGTRDQVPYEVS